MDGLGRPVGAVGAAGAGGTRSLWSLKPCHLFRCVLCSVLGLGEGATGVLRGVAVTCRGGEA